MAVSVLGLLGLSLVQIQLTALQRAYQNQLRSLALIQADSILARMTWRDKGEEQFALQADWNRRLGQLLPHAHGELDCSAMLSSCTAEVEWHTPERQVLAKSRHYP